MMNFAFASSRRMTWRGLGGWICLLTLPLVLCAAARSEKMPVVPKWSRFERRFLSTLPYTNALQQATLTVLFISPLGETNRVSGFWDGGWTWRVRFSPNLCGRWTYQTRCSNPANKGLHDRTGQFLCTAPIGDSPFRRHGPVRIARDHRHLEHADGTPFFWLADTVWDGARVAEPRDWRFYAGARAAQKFSAVQWSAAPGEDSKHQAAFTGRQRIAVHPKYFKRLDAKIDELNRAGLLSVIVPLREIDAGPADTLPVDQAILLLRYMAARWGAGDVAWLLAFGGSDVLSDAGNAARWREIGRSVFGDAPHATVVLFPGANSWVLDEFENEPWVDAFGYQTGQNVDEDSLKWLLAGPLTLQWKKGLPRPLINIAPPCENGITAQGDRRVQADEVRRAIWWSLLLSPPAGVSYAAEGVWNWNQTVDPPEHARQRDLPVWKKSLFLPGAKQMSHVAGLFQTVDFWQLTPASRVLGVQPGVASPARFIAAAGTGSGRLCLAYVPEGPSIDVLRRSLPASPAARWVNPSTGESEAVTALVSGSVCHFNTPGSGDWLLVVEDGKQADAVPARRR